jgi:hypothetical protein
MVGGGGAPFGASSVDASAASSKAVAMIKDAEMLTALSEARTNPTALAAAIHSRKQQLQRQGEFAPDVCPAPVVSDLERALTD